MRVLILTLILSGCSHSAVLVSNQQPVVPASPVNASGVVAAAVLIGTAAIAASQTTQATPSATTSSGWTSQPVPSLLPEREVNQQDCTRPIDLSAGNLRCR